jgi:hypothetical protein
MVEPAVPYSQRILSDSDVERKFWAVRRAPLWGPRTARQSIGEWCPGLPRKFAGGTPQHYFLRAEQGSPGPWCRWFGRSRSQFGTRYPDDRTAHALQTLTPLFHAISSFPSTGGGTCMIPTATPATGIVRQDIKNSVRLTNFGWDPAARLLYGKRLT